MIRPKQNEYKPDSVTPPGDTLRAALEALSMSQAELSLRIGKHKKTINEIIQGKQKITPETAVELEMALGVPARFWLNRQARFDEFQARTEMATQIRQESAKYAAWVKSLPVHEMVKGGWIPASLDDVERAGNLLTFFGVTSLDQWREVWGKKDLTVAFHQSPLSSGERGALAAWLRRGQLETQRRTWPNFDLGTFRAVLNLMRAKTTDSPPSYLADAVEACANAGVALVYVSQLPGLRVYGATWWPAGRPIMQLSLRGKKDHFFWFTFFHEAFHVLHHGKEVFIESEVGLSGTRAKLEEEANQLAEDFLIPRKSWTQFVRAFQPYSRGSKVVKEKLIRDFARKLGLCSGIVVGRLHHEGIIPFSHCNNLVESVDISLDGTKLPVS